MKADRCRFVAEEQAIQLAYFERNLAERTGHRGRAFQLRMEHRLDGLLPGIRDRARDLFATLGVQFHSYVGHARSSQAACLNFLMPLADRPDLLIRWTRALGLDPAEMLPIEKESADPHRFVAFEYTGPEDRDFLGEAEGGVPKRGAHATASDAAVAFIDSDGRRQLILIEWKYTEEYRHHRLSEDKGGKRIRRYGDKAFFPSGPIRNDLRLELADFFREPFYQLLRQQMLAWQIERSGCFDRVRVLHLSPRGNRALHSVTAPALRVTDGVAHGDAFAAYRATLVDPDAFLERSIEDAFAPLQAWEAPWLDELAARYPSLIGPSAGGAA